MSAYAESNSYNNKESVNMFNFKTIGSSMVVSSDKTYEPPRYRRTLLHEIS